MPKKSLTQEQLKNVNGGMKITESNPQIIVGSNDTKHTARPDSELDSAKFFYDPVAKVFAAGNRPRWKIWEYIKKLFF